MGYIIVALKTLLVAFILMIFVSIAVSFVNFEIYIPFKNDVSRLIFVFLLIPSVLIVKISEER
jgi:hypothetical protein